MMEQGKSGLLGNGCLGDAGGEESLSASGTRKSFMKMLNLERREDFVRCNGTACIPDNGKRGQDTGERVCCLAGVKNLSRRER